MMITFVEKELETLIKYYVDKGVSRRVLLKQANKELNEKLDAMVKSGELAQGEKHGVKDFLVVEDFMPSTAAELREQLPRSTFGDEVDRQAKSDREFAKALNATIEAAVPACEHEWVQYAAKSNPDVHGAPCCRKCGVLMEAADPERWAAWFEANRHRYNVIDQRTECTPEDPCLDTVRCPKCKTFPSGSGG